MKKAWLREYETLCNSVPVLLEEDEQSWLFSEQIEDMDNIMLKMKWKSNVPGSFAPERVIIGAIAAMERMGYDVSEAESLIDEGIKYHEEDDMISLNRVTWRIWNILNNAKKVEGHEYHNYTVYDTYEKYYNDINHDRKYKSVDKDSQEFFDSTYYGWVAQICAGALGTALEGYTKDQLRKAFGEIHSYVREPNTYNDDFTFEFAFLQALLRKGNELTSEDIAEDWAALVPFAWSAEEWALKNIKSGIYPPESGYMNNPYREWIGAQMRGAICGMVAPADPVKASELAFKDGVVSHHNNGVLGEIFNAVITSLAYCESNVRTIVEEALTYIPQNSEYYSVVKFAYDCCTSNDDWEAAWDLCAEKFKKYNWIHAYPNAAAEVVALWYGEGDFNKTMHVISMVGYDVDCNAAQIATALGIIHRENTMDKKWTDPIGDEMKTYIRGYKNISIKGLAKLTVEAAKLV